MPCCWAALCGLTPPQTQLPLQSWTLTRPNWSHMVRSPAGIEIGDGGAPFIKRLSWQQWRATYANGTGKLHVQHNPSC